MLIECQHLIAEQQDDTRDDDTDDTSDKGVFDGSRPATSGDGIAGGSPVWDGNCLKVATQNYAPGRTAFNVNARISYRLSVGRDNPDR